MVTSNIKSHVRGGRVLRGTVVSDKMRDTVAVVVTRYVKHPRVGKYVRCRKKYLAHDAGNTHHTGDTVTIRETRPLSKRKSFIVAP
ncbi:MAG: 30S ribosomal protein S17 [bacterium]|nr:30S ribosomal protein S17 [bacterium]MDZ4285217.1 30S ribosomal protein S17 [Patescibacteria group bacterium]